MNDVVLSDGNQCDVRQSDHLCLAYLGQFDHHYMGLCARRAEQDEHHGERLCRTVVGCRHEIRWYQALYDSQLVFRAESFRV